MLAVGAMVLGGGHGNPCLTATSGGSGGAGGARGRGQCQRRCCYSTSATGNASNSRLHPSPPLRFHYHYSSSIITHGRPLHPKLWPPNPGAKRAPPYGACGVCGRCFGGQTEGNTSQSHSSASAPSAAAILVRVSSAPSRFLRREQSVFQVELAVRLGGSWLPERWWSGPGWWSCVRRVFIGFTFLQRYHPANQPTHPPDSQPTNQQPDRQPSNQPTNPPTS